MTDDQARTLTVVPNTNPALHTAAPVITEEPCDIHLAPIVAWAITAERKPSDRRNDEPERWLDAVAIDCHGYCYTEEPAVVFDARTEEWWAYGDCSGKGKAELLAYFREEHRRKLERARSTSTAP